MAHDYVALLRGINVGRAKRIAMADLRELVTSLGYSQVRTLLNSGNVLFRSNRALPKTAPARLEQAIEAEFGVPSRVVLLSAREVAAIAAENPLLDEERDPSRLLLSLPRVTSALSQLEPLVGRSWAPEALALGRRAAYLWCPGGILKSRLAERVSHALAGDLTSRNWATFRKIEALLSAQE